MTVECLVCGSRFFAPRGNCKYCKTCRDEIDRNTHIYGGFSKAAAVAIAQHKEEHDNTVRMNKLRAESASIDYVVHLAKQNARSYGHQVAVMEGRLYK